MPETKADILVVESNGSQRYALCRSLRRLGHHTHEAHSTSAALQFQKSTPVDLILVDLDLPRADGVLRLLDALRERDPELVVILMITRSSLETALAALRGGAFDYLSKPIHSDTLRDAVARGLAQAMQIQNRRFLLKSIRDQLDALDPATINSREGSPLPAHRAVTVETSPIQLGDLIVHPGRYQLQSGYGEVNATPTEFDLLLYLAAHQERVVTCGELVRELRGYHAEEQEARVLIRPHISNLRRKLRAIQSTSNSIVNVRGVGYRLAIAPAE